MTDLTDEQVARLRRHVEPGTMYVEALDELIRHRAAAASRAASDALAEAAVGIAEYMDTAHRRSYGDAPISDDAFDGWLAKYRAARDAARGEEPAAVIAHPRQPLLTDERGTRRFKENAIVRHVIDWCASHNGLAGMPKVSGKAPDLNVIAGMDFPREDRVQLAQLIGYSMSGFGELSYVEDADMPDDAFTSPGGDDGSATRKDAGAAPSGAGCQDAPSPPGTSTRRELRQMLNEYASGARSIGSVLDHVAALLDRVAREAHAKGYAEGHEQQMKMRVLDAQEAARRPGK